MTKKYINRTLISGKYPLAIFFIISSLISFSLFIKIFKNLNLEYINQELLTENIILFIGAILITALIYYFKKTYKEEPTLSFDDQFLYLEEPNKKAQTIAIENLLELHKPILQSGRASRWDISYAQKNAIHKLEILVIQKRNFTQFRKIIKKKNPSVKFTGFLNSIT